MKTLWRHAHLVTLADRGYGEIERGALVAHDDRIAWVGPDDGVPRDLRVDAEHDLDGALVTPGLVDCHTHLIYGGERAREFEQRLQGATYEAIARAGGGIRSTVAATRAASDAALFASASARARTLIAGGVTTLEIKSGYGLSFEHEARCLRIARRVGAELGVTVRATCLAAHAVPVEFEGRADDYVDAVCGWLPPLVSEGLVDAVDVFCETIGFTTAQTRRIFEVAGALGVPVKLHAEQLCDHGGAALAANAGALSCDHLEWLSAEGVAAMARSGSVAVLLPGAFYFLRETKVPPVQALRDAGVPIAVASDHNPGTSPILSMPLILNMACTLFRLTPEVALRGATVIGARALGLRDRGRLAVGQRADLAVWALDQPAELAYWAGHNPCRRVVVGGCERNAA
jgi:imidazolonepropionase